MSKIIFVLALSCFLQIQAYAVKLGLGAGSYALMYGHLQKNETDRNTGLIHNLYLGGFIEFPIFILFGMGTELAPEIGYVFLPTGDANSNNLILLNLDFATTVVPRVKGVSPDIRLRYGLGLQINRTGGKGGAVERRNGASTATYYRPSKGNYSFASTLNFGGDLVLPSPFGSIYGIFFRPEVYILGLLDGAGRQINILLSAGMIF